MAERQHRALDVNDNIHTYIYTDHIPEILLAQNIYLCREGNEEKKKTSNFEKHHGNEGRVYRSMKKAAAPPTKETH